MVAIAPLELLTNSYGLYGIAKHRQGEVPMGARRIFSQNDAVTNVSGTIAGGRVVPFQSPYFDWMVGVGIAGFVL